MARVAVIAVSARLQHRGFREAGRNCAGLRLSFSLLTRVRGFLIYPSRRNPFHQARPFARIEGGSAVAGHRDGDLISVDAIREVSERFRHGLAQAAASDHRPIAGECCLL
jgi:hypothetical protein